MLHFCMMYKWIHLKRLEFGVDVKTFISGFYIYVTILVVCCLMNVHYNLLARVLRLLSHDMMCFVVVSRKIVESGDYGILYQY